EYVGGWSPVRSRGLRAGSGGCANAKLSATCAGIGSSRTQVCRGNAADAKRAYECSAIGSSGA
ncbi:MAG: hypothetical protein WAJ97_08850, partial [Terriglobales bacterium]